MEQPFNLEQFYQDVLKVNGIDRSFGVPDSTLSPFLSYLAAAKCTRKHITVASEGAAVALAAGYYLSTSNLALVYMQNSGYSNALNPLQSLVAKEVFGIPMLLMIGWRGRPGEKDEPQHNLIGPGIVRNLEANDIPYEVIPKGLAQARIAVARLFARAKKDNTPVALIVPANYFAAYEDPLWVSWTTAPPNESKTYQWLSSTKRPALSRESTIESVLGALKPSDVSVSSLGGNSRELWMLRKNKGQSIARNFFGIGAHGVSNGCRKNRVICIDGDGSFMMHLGNNAILAPLPDQRVIHVVIYNGKHSSTGNQPLMIGRGDFLALVEGLPYERKFIVDTTEGVTRALGSVDRSALIVVTVNGDERKSLPRPTETPTEQKEAFMKSFGTGSKLLHMDTQQRRGAVCMK
ncbi:phosphonopyruvate decarboxylase, putative [Talaromyces stipitatus ATCC 10500]|uniref:Phosphonopyruvate decarboxylase, putative n=1 Tax=Talaromyces stipitatus (strain ATCC 10500 / CBS 375.48 / QM 6759 / NRRL 1006) TaxID=441959 RepID=B8MDA6_TALSN|nr:phosphonopyruvate decarboxylase, putative [Talaromyces stipitatus ATCC 10500]EED17631.1 phosphonopyruvate decarboxylase, putative [Talaromyces stipitatus ATCC 10500]